MVAEHTAWKPLLRFTLHKLANYLPAFILKGLYPLRSLENHIDLDVRRFWGLEFGLYGIPRAHLWFKITNRSPYIDVEVDRISVDIWDDQPLASLVITERFLIRRCTTREDVHGQFELNEFQVKRIRERKQPDQRFTLYARATFNTVLGLIELPLVTIDNVHPGITG